MTPFLDIYGFVSVVLRGLILVFEALMVGGVIFWLGIANEYSNRMIGTRIASLVACFSTLLAITQTVYLGTNSVVLIQLTNLTWAEARGAAFFVWGTVVVVGALLVGLLARTRFAKVACPAGCVLALYGAVMGSHSAARVDHRSALVALTMAHHLATSAWVGGIPYLLLSLNRINDEAVSRAIVKRFSKVAMISAGLLLSAGLLMARMYIGSVPALTGTSYGLMLLSKVALTAVLLVLGWLNLRIVRKVRAGGAPSLFPLRRFAEAEVGVGLTIILTAASLTSSPPAIDVQTGRVSAAEIEVRMTPRWPLLHTPALKELSPASPLSPDPLLSASFGAGQKLHDNNSADIAWSEYNHHWAGIVVLAIGVLSLLAQRWDWARIWPLAFLGLAVFLLIRADSENWPLGPRGFWESFQVAEVAQHRLFVLLIVIFAIFEWRVQTSRLGAERAGLVFPLVCAAGGALLLTHSHSLGNAKEEFLAELSHVPLALLAVIAGWSRWLELRLALAGIPLRWVWPVCFTLIGGILLNYREA